MLVLKKKRFCFSFRQLQLDFNFNNADEVSLLYSHQIVTFFNYNFLKNPKILINYSLNLHSELNL